MLVLSRKLGERIRIGEEIVVSVVRIQGGTVRIGIEAPANLSVLRQELVSEAPSGEEARPSVSGPGRGA